MLGGKSTQEGEISGCSIRDRDVTRWPAAGTEGTRPGSTLRGPGYANTGCGGLDANLARHRLASTRPELPQPTPRPLAQGRKTLHPGSQYEGAVWGKSSENG